MMYHNKRLILAVVTDIQDTCVTYPGCNSCYSKLLVDPVSQSLIGPLTVELAALEHLKYPYRFTMSLRYHCIKCNTSYHGNQVAWRYRLVVTIADSSAIGTVVVFGRTLDPLFGKTASDFHRSLTDLERSGYPAESMLLEALLHTFHGKYFYFGFKLTGNSHTGSLTLEDVLKSTGDESQTHSLAENNFDNCHTLAYQILPNSASKLVTVTDYMRQSVSLLKHGHILKDSSHQSTCNLSKSCSSQNASKGTVIGSYIENSKQDSVAFSFEESDNISESSTREFQMHLSGKDNTTNKVFSANEKNCATNTISHLVCMTHKNKLFSKQNKIFEYSQEYSKTLDDDISIFTNDIIKKLEYTCGTKELDMSSTSSKIDHELKVREIKRSVTSLSQAIMTNQNYKSNCHNNRDTFQNKEDTEVVCQESLDDVSHIHKADDFTKLAVSNGKNTPYSLPCSSTGNLLTSNGIEENFKSNPMEGFENSASLTAFLESQFSEEIENVSNKAQKKEILRKEEHNHSNYNLTCANHNMFSDSVAFCDTSKLNMMVNEPVYSCAPPENSQCFEI